MATKQKHGAAGLLQQAQRALEKGDFKQALKDAKLGHRQQPGPEGRQLLERAYLARGRQLYRVGLQDQAQAVVEDLLALGATEASVQQELPKLLIALGLFNRVAAVSGANATLEDDSPLYAAAADHAVLRPDKVPASLPAVRQGAETIRRTLAALEAGDEAEAMAVLKDIARASPFADWKYFVRGLAAYYRQDAAEMQANWERLDAGRFAAKIAKSLKVLADPAVVSIDDFHTANTLARLGSVVLGGPILARLQTLQGHVAAGRWREAVKLLRADTPVLRQIDAALPQRLASILYAAIVHKGNPAALRELAAVMDPLPIDPHSNRGLAMAWERLEDDYDDGSEDDVVHHIERYWRTYLDDLARLECLLPAERTLARSLVWQRLGRMLTEESCPIRSTCGIRHEPEEDLQIRAIDCFEDALKLSPELLSGYQDLAAAYREWGESEHAAATWRRLVERFPEHLETLLLLVEHHIGRDEPFAAGEFVFRAERLKPLDSRIKKAVLSIHLASARHHALAGRWDDGRAEFTAAEKLESPYGEASHILVRRAAFELKAGDLGLANRLLDRARNELGEAAPIWLLMAIESRRYALSKVVVDEFEHRWLTVLRKSRRSAAAGEMCRLIATSVMMNVNYSGRDEHVERLLDFLHDCKRIRKWRVDDLRNILQFLMVVDHREQKEERSSESGTNDLLAAFAATARGKFPDVAFFQYLVGEMEMRKGPWESDRRLARKCFERVLQLGEGPNDPEYVQTAKHSRNRLDMLEETNGLPFHTATPFSLPFVEQEEDEGDESFAEPFNPFAFGQGSDGHQTYSLDDLPKDLIGKISRLCREMGVDPIEFMNRNAADGGVPFRFRAEDAPSSKKKRK